MALFLKLQKAVLERDQPIVERYLIELENVLINGFDIDDDHIKSKWLDLLGCLFISISLKDYQ